MIICNDNHVHQETIEKVFIKNYEHKKKYHQPPVINFMFLILNQQSFSTLNFVVFLICNLKVLQSIIH